MALGKTDQSESAPVDLIDAVLLVLADATRGRRSYVELLVDEGYRVTEAHDVEAAVAGIAAHNASLVFVPCRQRGRALVTLLETLRPLRALGVPVVLLGEGWEARIRDTRSEPEHSVSPGASIDGRSAPTAPLTGDREAPSTPEPSPAVRAFPEQRATSQGPTVRRRRNASASRDAATTAGQTDLTHARGDMGRAGEPWQASEARRQSSRLATDAVGHLITALEAVNNLRWCGTSAARPNTKLLDLDSGTGPELAAAVKARHDTARRQGGLMDSLDHPLNHVVPSVHCARTARTTRHEAVQLTGTEAQRHATAVLE